MRYQDRSLLTSWYSLLFGASAVLIVQYLALKYTNIPRIALAVALVVFCISQTLSVLNSEWDWSEVAFAQWIFNALRVVDVALRPVEETANWSLVDYLEFVYTFETKRSRLYAQSQLKKRAMLGDAQAKHRLSRLVPYKQLDLWYFARIGLQKAMAFVFANWVIMRVRMRSGWNPAPFSLGDWINAPLVTVDYMLMGLGIVVLLDLGIDVLGYATAFVFQIDFEPAMDSPWLSCSLKEFWALRWNSVVQRCLKRIAFVPTIKMGSKNAHRKQIIAVFNTFLLSGLLHEWLVAVVCVLPSTLEQGTFFLVHGVMCIVEAWWIRQWKDTWMMRMPRAVYMLYVIIVSGILAPLFLNPFIRDGTFVNFTTWVV